MRRKQSRETQTAFADNCDRRIRERARAALLARLKRQRVMRTKRWTRDEPYDGR